MQKNPMKLVIYLNHYPEVQLLPKTPLQENFVQLCIFQLFGFTKDNETSKSFHI